MKALTKAMWAEERAFADANPQWIAAGLRVTNQWGNSGHMLQYEIATALKAAYEAGTRGEMPEAPTPPAPPRSRIIRRAEPTPEPTPTRSRIVRRTR